MLLSTVVGLVIAASTALAFPLLLFSQQRVASGMAAEWVAERICAFVTLCLVALLCFRSPAFGVDTPAYLDFFASYCRGIPDSAGDTSFALSAYLLNLAMLGACSPSLLPASWAILVTAMLLAAGTRAVSGWVFASLILASMIGIELTTNAMRQGLSASALVAAVAIWQRSKVVAGLTALLAVALHESAALAFAALGISLLPWRWFIPAMACAVAIALALLQTDLPLRFLDAFVYEIVKYLGHDDDELYIRFIAGALLVSALALPLLAATSWSALRRLITDSDWNRAARIAATSVPLLLLPYFGYRYVYAVYPLVLWMILRAARRQLDAYVWCVFLLFLSGTASVVVWSTGSGYMRSVPFVQ